MEEWTVLWFENYAKPVKNVSSVLGHYSADFTLDVYTHVTGDMQKMAAEKVGNFIAQAV